MICSKCKREISRDDKFCGYCGSKANLKEDEDSYPRVPEEYRVEHVSRPKKQVRQKRSIIYLLFKNWKLTLFVSIALFIIWNIIFSDVFSTREFPELEGPKTTTFTWEYDGRQYLMKKTLYKTVYDYYKSNPDKDYYEGDNYEIWLKGYLKEAEEDNTISEIASDIKAVALKNGLRGDELLELTVAFVQSIPYDEDRLELITYSNKPEDLYPRYPYEVLYDNEGICGGKSFLAASLIEELGYGVALFDYDPLIEGDIGHIAPAVKCPKEYSSYNSGYCHTEVTERGFKIGDMPIGFDAGIPKIRTTINLFERESAIDLGGLKDAEIYVIVNGNSYQAIIDTAKTIQRIETLEKEMINLDWVINSLESEVTQLENNANYYDQQAEAAYRKHLIWEDEASYNTYLRLYNQYESAYTKFEIKADEYERKINQYNNLVYQYNVLIEDFYE